MDRSNYNVCLNVLQRRSSARRYPFTVLLYNYMESNKSSMVESGPGVRTKRLINTSDAICFGFTFLCDKNSMNQWQIAGLRVGVRMVNRKEKPCKHQQVAKRGNLCASLCRDGCVSVDILQDRRRERGGDTRTNGRKGQYNVTGDITPSVPSTRCAI